MDAEFEALLAKARALPPMTADERAEQSLSFAYGNLACTMNHRPTPAAFREIAVGRMGWSEERFERWAAGREWER